ncbi:MAG TPA: SRPBCC domain-containing protein [Tepidisphaeraceae bacterium]|nr:SRPBCC domain-containing protein [Tepidisphaeraceae bacterium]
MIAEEIQSEVQVLKVKKDIQIAAPIEVVFQTIIESFPIPNDMKLKLEPWVGGRLFRDLGNNTGHLWGHVQVIKPPKLLEIVGPLMMSYPVASHVSYRLTEEGGKTLLVLMHQAIGLITKDHLEGVNKGWGEVVTLIAAKAEGKR